MTQKYEPKENKQQPHLNVLLCPFRKCWHLSPQKAWLCLCHLYKRTKAEMHIKCKLETPCNKKNKVIILLMMTFIVSLHQVLLPFPFSFFFRPQKISHRISKSEIDVFSKFLRIFYKDKIQV